MDFRIIEMDSAAYEEMKELRSRVLLRPIGVLDSYIETSAGSADILLGGFWEQRLIACCVLTPRSAGTVQLRQMAVDPSEQGRGIGRRLLAFAEEVANQRGFTRLTMHARDAVIPFYEKCGYAVVDDGFEEVGIPHHTMIKELKL